VHLDIKAARGCTRSSGQWVINVMDWRCFSSRGASIGSHKLSRNKRVFDLIFQYHCPCSEWV